MENIKRHLFFSISLSSQFSKEVLGKPCHFYYRSIHLNEYSFTINDQLTQLRADYFKVRPDQIKEAKALFNMTGSLYETLYALDKDRLLELENGLHTN